MASRDHDLNANAATAKNPPTLGKGSVPKGFFLTKARLSILRAAASDPRGAVEEGYSQHIGKILWRRGTRALHDAGLLEAKPMGGHRLTAKGRTFMGLPSSDGGT